MSSKIFVCTQCGYIGKSEGAIKGNGCIEILLWVFFIIPGLIYSIWRSSSRFKVCPKCKSPSLIPTDSPRAQKIMGETMSKEEVAKTVEVETEKSLEEKKKRTIIIVVLIIIIILSFALLSSFN